MFYKNKKNILLPTLGIFFTLLAWEVLPRIFNVHEIIFPPFSIVFKALISQPIILAKASFITLIEAVAGLLTGFLMASLFAVFFYYSLTFEKMFLPILILFRSIPIIVLAPLLEIQFDSVIVVSIAMASIISFFPILINMISGIRSISREAKELFIVLNATKSQTLLLLGIPLAMRDIFNGLKIGATFAVIGAIVAEFVTAEKGIGARVSDMAYNSQTDDSFAAILCAAAIGTIMFYAVEIIERHINYLNKLHS